MKDSTITRLHTTDKGYFDFDSSVPCIIAGKYGFLSSEEFRSYMNYGLQLIIEKVKDHQQLGWIANINQANIYAPEDGDWVINYWNSAAIEAGLRYVAFIMPESDFVKTSMDNYTKRSVASGGFIIRTFKEIETAKTWIRAQLHQGRKENVTGQTPND